MSPPAPSWQSVAEDFTADGSLRDIYVFGTDEAVWSRFLAALRTSRYTCDVSHGGEPIDSWIERFEHAATLQQVNPVLLRIMVGPIQVNCHFFTSDELELDVDPRQVTAEPMYLQLLDFLTWLAVALGRPVSVTHENAENLRILHVTPEGDITTGRS